MHVIVDGSYYVFYRAYATVSWYRRAVPDSEYESPWDDEKCVQKYRDTFRQKLETTLKKINVVPTNITIVKDCPRGEIWRNQHTSGYKDGRRKPNAPMDILFEMAYGELFPSIPGTTVLQCPFLEADDCAALTVKHLRDSSDADMVIITNDLDYSQLLSDRVSIWNLDCKPLTSLAGCTGNASLDLFCKIVCGDKSDNIAGVFPRCGIATARKLYGDPDLLEKWFTKHEGSRELFERNKVLVDFNMIPNNLVDDFIELNRTKLERLAN